MSDIISITLIRILFDIDISAGNGAEGWFEILGVVLSKTICFSAYAIIIKISKRGEEKLVFKDWVPLLSVPLASILNLLLIVEYIQKMAPHTVNAPLVLAAMLGSFFINILVFFFYERLKDSMKVKQQLSLMKQQTDLQSKHYAEIESSHSSTRAIWHDMNNHLTVMSSLVQKGDLERLKSYLDEVGKTIHGLVLPSRTEHTVLDALINEKYRLAKQLGINFELRLSPIAEDAISAMDLCIIVGNALDNAIEACQKVGEGAFIQVRIEQVGDNISIVVHNSAPQELHHNKDLKTTKKDKSSHGFGISNIKKTLEKHDGSFDWGLEDDVFKFSAFIPI